MPNLVNQEALQAIADKFGEVVLKTNDGCRPQFWYNSSVHNLKINDIIEML